MSMMNVEKSLEYTLNRFVWTNYSAILIPENLENTSNFEE